MCLLLCLQIHWSGIIIFFSCCNGFQLIVLIKYLLSFGYRIIFWPSWHSWTPLYSEVNHVHAILCCCSFIRFMIYICMFILNLLLFYVVCIMLHRIIRLVNILIFRMHLIYVVQPCISIMRPVHPYQPCISITRSCTPISTMHLNNETVHHINHASQ